MALHYDFYMLLVGLLFALAQAAPAPPSTDELATARAGYEATLAHDPGNIAAQGGEVAVSEQLALRARADKDMNGALGALLQAQKFAPDNSRLLYDVGIVEEEIGLYQDAIATITHLRALSPANPKVQYLAARVELDLGRLAEAEKDMRSYLQAEPDDATAHFGLGRILQLAPQPAAAKVLARDPRHGGALATTGTAYFRLKQYPQAAQALEQAVAVAPDYQPGHYYYGLVLARLGRKADSDRELALATKLAEEQNKKDAQRLRLQP